jgi:hypothetical protein
MVNEVFVSRFLNGLDPLRHLLFMNPSNSPLVKWQIQWRVLQVGHSRQKLSFSTQLIENKASPEFRSSRPNSLPAKLQPVRESLSPETDSLRSVLTVLRHLNNNR